MNLFTPVFAQSPQAQPTGVSISDPRPDLPQAWATLDAIGQIVDLQATEIANLETSITLSNREAAIESEKRDIGRWTPIAIWIAVLGLGFAALGGAATMSKWMRQSAQRFVESKFTERWHAIDPTNVPVWIPTELFETQEGEAIRQVVSRLGFKNVLPYSQKSALDASTIGSKLEGVFIVRLADSPGPEDGALTDFLSFLSVNDESLDPSQVGFVLLTPGLIPPPMLAPFRDTVLFIPANNRFTVGTQALAIARSLTRLHT